MRRLNVLRIAKAILLISCSVSLALITFIWLSDPLKKWQRPDAAQLQQTDKKSYANADAEDTYKLNHPKINGKGFDSAKKDWHDLVAIAKDLSREGLGECGKPVYLKNFDKQKQKFLYSQNNYNALVSDFISLNRSVPDVRDPKCKKKKYLSQLPKTSVVIPFFNVHWSTLLRTVYSVLNRSPPELIEEIILVDDHSTKKFLHEKLDTFVENFLPKVKVLRLPERSGLILARLAGAKIAKGEVLTIIDANIEVNYNWLPPLLEPIALNPKACVCPTIDFINPETFEYVQEDGVRGAFDWYFGYKTLPLLPEDLVDKTKPFKNPIMLGCAFAINADFFWELGGFDEGLDIWGGEQYELSFKIWMCGGELLDVPCSRVGHLYKGGAPYNNARKWNFLYKNHKRVAEVWMDEYKEYVYSRMPQTYKNIDPGDLTKMKELRKRLKCKSFKWFMENIAFDLPKKYPMTEPPGFACGAIQSVLEPNFCLDTLSRTYNEEVGLYSCPEDLTTAQGNHRWRLRWEKDIQNESNGICLAVPGSHKNAPVLLNGCHEQQGDQSWFYDFEKKWLIQGKYNKCLDANFDSKKVFVNNCEDSNPNMKWNFGFVNKTALLHFYDI